MRTRGAALTAVVVDDHRLFRGGVVELLREHGIEVVAEAGSGQEAVALAAGGEPAVILMDLSMPGMSGIEATRRIVAADPGARVLALTMTEDDDSVLDALVAGARGYVLKSAPPDELVAAVAATARGETALSPAVATRLVERLRRMHAGPPASALRAELSERELEVLRLVVEGRDNAEIAELLFLSPPTVKNHVSRILSKLGVENRLQAAVQAVRSGLV